MKTEQGLVVEVTNGVTKIKVGRHSDCKNCGACPGSDSIIIDAINKIGATQGQRVLFEMKEDRFLKAAFIVFILPLILTFIGVLIGMFLGQYFNSNVHAFEIAGGIVTFLLSIVFVKKYDKAEKKNSKSQPVITRIL